jgi:hypothetical protein
MMAIFANSSKDTGSAQCWTSSLAHLAKGNVTFCHHLAPVVCRPLTFHILIFSSETPQPNELTLGNCRRKFNKLKNKLKIWFFESFIQQINDLDPKNTKDFWNNINKYKKKNNTCDSS